MTKAPKLVAIVGPTGVGKSALAMTLAARFDGEVVNADSRLVYRGMDIGTAKPSKVDQRAIRHHLIDLVEPTDPFNLAQYLDVARTAIEEIQGREKLPFLVGGTGLYAFGVLDGIEAPKVPANWEMRKTLEERANAEGVESLMADLGKLDPDTAAHIDRHNLRRVVRALEVCLETGQPFSALRGREEPPYEALVLGLTMERKELYRRVNRRVEEMLAAGWVDEVRTLMAAGCVANTSSMSALGYRDIMAFLNGAMSIEDTVSRIQQTTRRFARRQSAWFRPADPRIHWLEASVAPEISSQVLVSEFIARQA
ncbi:MAG: tRNA dimethylallyltransferase [Chloroflexi bacterium]|jgi:tRNA dimethylallyltransferase|nr:MAG: tRNA dimethylallyltransferase [Chloroflexota bacterium]